MTQTGKIPPQDLDIERAVLGALLIDNTCLVTGMSRLFADVFYQDANRRIFGAIQAVYDSNQPVDLLNVIDRLRRSNDLEAVGGAFYLTKLTSDVISGANIESHIMSLSEKYLHRSMINIGAEVMTKAYDEGQDIFDTIAKTDLEIQSVQEKVLSGITRDVAWYGMKVIDQHSEVKKTGVLGIPTGLSRIDQMICGLVSPDLIIVAARPGQGKTGLALSITHETSVKRDEPCAWFSLEMDGVQLVRRLAAIESGIDHEKIRNGKTSMDEERTLNEAISRISKKKIFIEDKPSITIRDIRTRASLLKKKHGIRYIVVDYIQLMEGVDVRGKSRENIVSEISRGLKVIAKELGIPVIALSQLSRQVEASADKMPQLSHLRESGAIEQDADVVLFLMRPEYYMMLGPINIGDDQYDTKGLCIVSTAKNRHGHTGNIPLRFNGPLMHFTNYDLLDIVENFL